MPPQVASVVTFVAVEAGAEEERVGEVTGLLLTGLLLTGLLLTELLLTGLLPAQLP